MLYIYIHFCPCCFFGYLEALGIDLELCYKFIPLMGRCFGEENGVFNGQVAGLENPCGNDHMDGFKLQ